MNPAPDAQCRIVEPDVLAAIRRPIPEGLPEAVVLPNLDGFSLTGVAGLIESLFGATGETPPLAAALGANRALRVILLVLDGLGLLQLATLCAQGAVPALAALVESGRLQPITSVFPSTTATALASLATGLDPIAHGMLGYRLFLREIPAITDMLRLSIVGTESAGTALSAGLDLESLFTAQTLCQRLGASGVATHALLHRPIVGSGLSKILYRGCSHVHSAASFDDMCVATRQILDRKEGATFVSLYWSGLDSVGHARGPNSEAFLAEARTVDATLGRELLPALEDVLLLVTADHGMVPMRPEDYIPFASIDGGLPDRVTLPPTGESRANYLHTGDAESPDPDSVVELPGGLLHLSVERALEIGLFGRDDPHTEAHKRIGQELIVATANAGILQPYPNSVRLPGMHGGLTEDEMLVPLIAASF